MNSRNWLISLEIRASTENPKPRIENTAVSTREVTEVTCETYASGHEGAKRLIIDIVGIRPN